MTLVWPVDGELFTAVVGLKKVLVAEHDVAQELKTYINREQERIDTLKRVAVNFERHSREALKNPEEHLSNPVNAFLVVKRFTTDWDGIVQNYLKNNATDEFLSKLDQKTDSFPDEEDLAGTAEALLRLQDVYALSADRMAHGNLHRGIADTVSMTAEDCYELGRLAYLKDDFYHTILWMQEGLKLLESDTTLNAKQKDTLHAKLLDHLAYAVYMQGNVHEALRLTNEFLKLNPTHVRLLQNKKFFEEMVAELPQGNAPTVLKNERPTDEYRSSSDFVDYERLCRGEETHLRNNRDLTCQFRRHHPLFFIQPLREEVLNLNPRLVVYHNAVSNSDMERIKELATPRLKRATVQNSKTGELETASYRVSKSAWLKDPEDYIVNRISQLSKAMSNLSIETVEELQVVNYGIGGHYEPHYDHAQKNDVSAFEESKGNRIATFICYLTDVEAGGATAFNLVGARVNPEKGACAVWYNLLRNGESDLGTRHAACPVLVGSKWVMNKWFHERGQEFTRRCSLSKDE